MHQSAKKSRRKTGAQPRNQYSTNQSKTKTPYPTPSQPHLCAHWKTIFSPYGGGHLGMGTYGWAENSLAHLEIKCQPFIFPLGSHFKNTLPHFFADSCQIRVWKTNSIIKKKEFIQTFFRCKSKLSLKDDTKIRHTFPNATKRGFGMDLFIKQSSTKSTAEACVIYTKRRGKKTEGPPQAWYRDQACDIWERIHQNPH
jgi:hypothetical protein